MQLTDEQKAAVARWIAESAGVSEIQSRLRSEFGLALTYMDTRLLIGELDLTPADAAPSAPLPSPTDAGRAGRPAAPPRDAAEALADDLIGGEEPNAGGADPFQPGPGAPRVRVTIDDLIKPNALLSGKVTFSDGEAGVWQVDSLGRLAVSANKAGYRPSQQDLLAFQMELDRLARSQGY